jgi:hypothetical protein
MSHDPFEVWYEERQMLNGEPPFPCSWDAARAAWQAREEIIEHMRRGIEALQAELKATRAQVYEAQEQHAAPALQVKGRTCVTCGHMKVWDVEQSDVPRAPLSDAEIETIADQDEDDSRCPTCGEDGGTSCGMPNCGFITGGTEPSEQPAAPGEPMTRFCPGCGRIGAVSENVRDCCPDGIRARLIPESLAQHCRDLFYLALHTHIVDETAAEPRAPLSDEQIEDCYDAAKRSYIAERGQVRGQMCLPSDNFNWHFARAIEAAISKGEA